MRALVAWAYLTVFCSASRQQKYTAASVSWPKRPIPSASTATGTADLLACALRAASQHDCRDAWRQERNPPPGRPGSPRPQKPPTSSRLSAQQADAGPRTPEPARRRSARPMPPPYSQLAAEPLGPSYPPPPPTLPARTSMEDPTG